ncbi:NB-ARC domain-containing protein [Streptomyces murinus]|uniref:NB-ARC domain-containing protein n=1 Tax=Streptomyces murinus TaxID=33900 RepID=UPI00382B86BB
MVRDRIDQARDGHVTVVLSQVLSGGGGVGKTQLAAAYAHQALADGADLVVWVDASDIEQVIARYAHAAHAVEAAADRLLGKSAESDAQLFLQWLATTRRSWLVVLDDLTDPEAMQAWWPPSSAFGCGRVLATTRRHDAILSGGGRAVVDINAYSAEEAGTYLHERLSSAHADHLLDAQAALLAEALGFLPLALSHAAAYMVNDAVCGVLWPPKRSHLVTLAVHGTRELRGLSTFVADCQQWKLWAGQTEDDLPRRRAIRKLARLMGPVEGSAVLVSSPTEAADPDTAVRIARRELSEALDHYAAGDRLINLHLAPEWASEVSTNQPTFGTVRTPGQRVSYPLTGYMPASLRAAMRAANLARRVDAPMASAALSWSALETTGLKPTEVKLLAGACALQTLRRHLASAHSLLIAGGRAHLEHQRHRVKMEQAQLRRYEKGVRGCELSDNPHAQAALITHLEQVELFRTRVAYAEQELQTVEAAVNADLAALGTYVQTEGMKERLMSFDVWLDVLLPTQAVSSPSLHAAQAAAVSLAKRCGGLAAETFALWRSRLAVPQDLATWLDRQAGTYRGVLEWLYATRNMVIHRGHFTAPSDELTAHAARGIVDMALEFLSNWHTVERSRAVNETPAKYYSLRFCDC